MKIFLIIRLRGVMQAWGDHTYEDFRPSLIFPTRSGISGLLAACLGIDRENWKSQKALSESFRFAVRSDAYAFPLRKITDFHTIKEARKVDGTITKFPVVTRREYLCDASFTVALEFFENASYKLNQIRQAITSPAYTPFLGRRACPPSAPIFKDIVEAEDFLGALSKIEPGLGVIYSEEKGESSNRYVIRDVPLCNNKRQFGTRSIYIHSMGE